MNLRTPSYILVFIFVFSVSCGIPYHLNKANKHTNRAIEKGCVIVTGKQECMKVFEDSFFSMIS